MKNKILGLIIIIAFGCNTKPVETKTNNNSDGISEPTTNWEDEVKTLKEEQSNKRQDFVLTMQNKSFNFLCYDECEGGVGVSGEELRKYGRRKPFDIKRKINNDTLKIKFKLISDCCLEYVGDVEKNEDTLRLSFENISYTPCDCYCYYYCEYFLPVDKYDSKFIYLGDSLLTKGKRKK